MWGVIMPVCAYARMTRAAATPAFTLSLFTSSPARLRVIFYPGAPCVMRAHARYIYYPVRNACIMSAHPYATLIFWLPWIYYNARDSVMCDEDFN
jgi:hypothetical protein